MVFTKQKRPSKRNAAMMKQPFNRTVRRFLTFYADSPLFFSAGSGSRIQNLLKLVRVEHLSGVQDYEVSSFLTHHTFDVFGSDTA